MGKSVTCVLLIDDDKATNFFNQRVVTKHNSFDNVNTVQSGKAALEYLSKVENKEAVKPDLIFLDINMPAMNGWEFLVEFAKLNKITTEGIKVILLSTSSNPDDVNESIKNHSVDDFINKPLSLDLLDNVIEKHFTINIVKS
ncbi:Response regulator receiver domain-containing protein [Aquimarina amphilecti]|uniref:Response regulator receiver domain-containing protein n=1 Tax=Aquimarina amphilecti TaxID=1038014 RepID=A0A1H7QHZ0_AQUAM|nr:response regulator [Aquimarina amphilecti]SEL47582.1 Response regulator receiver domain-containing protein [Aquimarina amphilecti]